MKVTITAPFGRVQVELSDVQAMTLLLDAVRMAGVNAMPSVPKLEPERQESDATKYPEETACREDDSCGDTEAREDAEPPLCEEAQEEEHSSAGGVKAGAAPERYRGFLYTRCKKCGRIRGYCAKSFISEMRCECGHGTPLHHLSPMTVRCRCCEKVFKYQTNLTEENFTIDCLGCGAPVEMVRHSRTGEYVAY